MEKIDTAIKIVEKALGLCKNPCVLCSFGKDSIATLWLVREIDKSVPVVYFKQAGHPLKHSYAQWLSELWNLEVHSDIPPISASIVEGDGCEIVYHYPFGQRVLKMPLGRYESEKPECGKDKYLQRNYGNYQFKWDLAFSGHRADDKDNVVGKIAFDCDILSNIGCPSIAYPIKTWTEADVLELFKKLGLRLPERYADIINAIEFNNDRYPYCSRCLDSRNPATVDCPVYGLKVSNCSSQLEHTNFHSEFNYLLGAQN